MATPDPYQAPSLAAYTMPSYVGEPGSVPAPATALAPPAYDTGAGAAGLSFTTASHTATAAPPPPLQAPFADAYGTAVVDGGCAAPPDVTATAGLPPALLPFPIPLDPAAAAGVAANGWPSRSPPRPPVPPPLSSPAPAPVVGTARWGAEEEADVDAPVALFEPGDASAAESLAEEAGAEEDDSVTASEGSPSSDSPQADALTRLYVHPVAASASALGNAFLLPAADPITAALARQQQQLRRGEPRSPLSPHTLQAFAAATAAGGRSRFLAELTSDDVLAPPPLALTWYPPVPPGVTKFAQRKRTADGSAVAEMQQRHELEMLAEEEEGSGSGVLPARRRLRVEGAVCAPDGTRQRPVEAGVGVGGSAVDGGAAEAASPAAAGVLDGAHRKRERDERVYEFLTRGRRLR